MDEDEENDTVEGIIEPKEIDYDEVNEDIHLS